MTRYKGRVSILSIVLIIGTLVALVSFKAQADETVSTDAVSANLSIPTSPSDVPANLQVSGKTLRSVILLSRHGNRAPDPSVKVICPNRQVQSQLYEKQHCGPGSMTRKGIKDIWDLGRATHRSYAHVHGLISPTYKRSDIFVQASSSDRTLVSATAWGLTAFPEASENDFQIPVATYSVPMSQDDLLEVRKSRCLGQLQQDVKKFDETLGRKVEKCKEFNRVLDNVSAACGNDLRNTKEITHGEFDIFDAVKDVADAITGDFLEGFPRMQGLSNETAVEFLTMAENLFQYRLYTTPTQWAYHTGKLPEKIQSIFERHVITRSQKLGLLAPVTDAKEDISAFAKLREPRKLLAYHCHREVLYGIAKFLGFNVTVERPGLPNGLIHPGAGFFFELWEDDAVPARKEGTLGQVSVESRFYVRTLLWVPCWEGDNFSYKDADGQTVCPMRVRILPQCGEEFCPLPMFNEIIETNFQAVGGDFRKQCKVPALSSEGLLRKQLRQIQGRISAIEKTKALMASTPNQGQEEDTVITARERQLLARDALSKSLAANREKNMAPHVKKRASRVAKSRGSTVFLEEQHLEEAHDTKNGLSTDAQDQDISFTPLRDSMSDVLVENH